MEQVFNESSNETLKRIVIRLEDKFEERTLIEDLLKRANNKDYGQEIKAQDLILMGLRSLTDKHIDKLKEQSITSKQKLQKAFEDAIKNENFKGSFEDFLCIKAKL